MQAIERNFVSYMSVMHKMLPQLVPPTKIYNFVFKTPPGVDDKSYKERTPHTRSEINSTISEEWNKVFIL